MSIVSMMPSNHLILCHPLLGDSAPQHIPCLVSKEVLVTKAFSEFQKSYLIRVVRKCQSKGKQSSKKNNKSLAIYNDVDEPRVCHTE